MARPRKNAEKVVTPAEGMRDLAARRKAAGMTDIRIAVDQATLSGLKALRDAAGAGATYASVIQGLVSKAVARLQNLKSSR